VVQVAKEIFNLSIDVKLLERSQQEVELAGGEALQEHVVFQISESEQASTAPSDDLKYRGVLELSIFLLH